MKLPRILFFSLNPFSIEKFYKYNEQKRACEKLSFRLIKRICVDNFSHTSDLIYFLEKEEKNDSLPQYIIIDYISLCTPKSEHLADSVNHSREIIIRAILKYPEIYFLFDETRNTFVDEFCFLDFIFLGFYKKHNMIGYELMKEYHSFRAEEKVDETYKTIVRGRDNLFDGSNLRYISLCYIHNALNVKRYNFSLFQHSRRDSLALCIEEEHSQNRFNSYVLYANGFRVLPIVTASELKYFNNINTEKVDIIIRDFDLQFPDARGSDKSVNIDNEQNEYKINIVDYIRGIKYWDSEQYDESHCPKQYVNKWYVPVTGKEEEDYNYWSNLQYIDTIFVSKGVHGIEFCKTQSELENKIVNKESLKGVFQNGEENQFVRGIRKPVSGIYRPFHVFEKIRDRYKSFEITDLSTFVMRDIESLTSKSKQKKYVKDPVVKLSEELIGFFVNKYHMKDKSHLYERVENYIKSQGFKHYTFDKIFWENETKNQAWVIDTSRENHNHGVPLDIYDLVQSMISRAEHYYNTGKYIRSAIIASETIELLNGFHEALMLQAYHTLAISENAIAMNVIGGSEISLQEDTIFRIKKIENEIERILMRSKGEEQTTAERRELKYNILNQIFSDCRAFCRDKEYFVAEDCFISAMAHVNEGFTLSDIWHEVRSIGKRVWNDWKAYESEHSYGKNK